MQHLQKIIEYFEIHSVEGIKECFENGVDPNLLVNGKPLVYELINMYYRSPEFKNCIKTFVDFGLKLEDKVLLSVLLDEEILLDKLLAENIDLLYKKYTFDCAFTPLYEASLLHICAEYNHVSCAKTLIKHGIDVNTKAGLDENGFGGQTSIFHTVNQDCNKSIEMMKLLISESADLLITVKGLIWGKGYDWETFIPSVNPMSYAMLGLLPQFQRTEKDIYTIIEILLKSAYHIQYNPHNIPNKYLKS